MGSLFLNIINNNILDLLLIKSLFIISQSVVLLDYINKKSNKIISIIQIIIPKKKKK